MTDDVDQISRLVAIQAASSRDDHRVAFSAP